ncbi:MAG TPA: ABC transporter substrate-binding protein [Devosiaceae bacterium]
MKLSKPKLLRPLACAAVLLAALANGAFAQTATPELGGTAIVAIGQDPTSANPAITSNTADRIVGCIIFEGLVNVGSTDLSIQPALAKSWAISPDGKTYTFNLVDAKWHDGQPFTSDDVKYSLLQVNTKYSPAFTAAGSQIASIDTPSPTQVVINLKQSYGPFLASLPCAVGGAIVPKHIYEGKEPASVTDLVGTGPFKLAEWQHGDYMRLARNPDYYVAGRPYLDEVVAKVINQAASRLQAVQSGDIDLIQYVPGADQVAVRTNPAVKIENSDISPTAHYLVFNTRKKPFDDKRVRQALMMAIDRDYVHKNVFFDIGKVGKAPFVQEIAWAANPAIDYATLYPFDVAKANALLDEAGYKRDSGGKRFTVHFPVYSTSWPEHQQTALAIQGMWKAIGVDVTVDAFEDATFNKKVYQDFDFDVAMSPLSSYDDPDIGIARGYVTPSIGKVFGNASGYSNPKVDDLFEAGRRGSTNEQRAIPYQQVQAILADDLPIATIDEFRNADVANTHLMGLWGHIEGNGDWSQAWLAK